MTPAEFSVTFMALKTVSCATSPSPGGAAGAGGPPGARRRRRGARALRAWRAASPWRALCAAAGVMPSHQQRHQHQHPPPLVPPLFPPLFPSPSGALDPTPPPPLSSRRLTPARRLQETLASFVAQVRGGEGAKVTSLLIEGPAGTGKTALAASAAAASGVPFVRLVSSEALVALGEVLRAPPCYPPRPSPCGFSTVPYSVGALVVVIVRIFRHAGTADSHDPL